MVATAQSEQVSNSQGLRYRRLLQLGSGGMATVHLALASGQGDFTRLVVVKAVREGNAALEELRRMFLAEARLSARLNHPNVVQVHEVVESDETVMLVMEYLDGLSLAEAYLTAATGFTLEMRLRVLCEVLVGLHYAHDLTDYEGQPLGIVHRDVSPQNVFLTYDGRVKLLDFGIAKATTLANRDETREGVVKGRIAYMPVEQFAGEKTDRRADIYAVGCMIWEAVAGTRMWGKCTDVEILQNVWSGKVPKLSEHVDVDRELSRIVERATAHKAEDRYPTAEALRLDLEAYLQKLRPATARDVGQFLSQSCQEQRQTRKKMIADAVTRAKAVGGASSNSESSGSLRSLVTPTPRSEEVTQDVERPRRRWVMPVALVTLALVGLVVVTRFPEAPRAAQSAATAEKPATAGLTVRVQPEDAIVFVDGIQATGNPPKLEVSLGSQHELRIERVGYRTEERSVRVEAETTLHVSLEAQRAVDSAPDSDPAASVEAPAPSPKPHRTVSVRRRSPVAAPAKSAAQAAEPQPDRCSPPFYFVKGIKTYKPECI